MTSLIHILPPDISGKWSQIIPDGVLQRLTDWSGDNKRVVPSCCGNLYFVAMRFIFVLLGKCCINNEGIYITYLNSHFSLFRYICIYPAYLNNKKTIAEGRRIPIDKVILWVAGDYDDVLFCCAMQQCVQSWKIYLKAVDVCYPP